MKRALILAALALGLVASLASGVEAAKTPKTGKTGAKGYDGTITKATTNMIVIDQGDGKGAVTALITDTTEITVGGKAGRPNDLAKGQTVHVTLSKGKVSKIEASG